MVSLNSHYLILFSSIQGQNIFTYKVVISDSVFVCPVLTQEPLQKIASGKAGFPSKDLYMHSLGDPDLTGDLTRIQLNI